MKFTLSAWSVWQKRYSITVAAATATINICISLRWKTAIFIVLRKRKKKKRQTEWCHERHANRQFVGSGLCAEKKTESYVVRGFSDKILSVKWIISRPQCDNNAIKVARFHAAVSEKPREWSKWLAACPNEIFLYFFVISRSYWSAGNQMHRNTEKRKNQLSSDE